MMNLAEWLAINPWVFIPVVLTICAQWLGIFNNCVNLASQENSQQPTAGDES